MFWYLCCYFTSDLYILDIDFFVRWVMTNIFSQSVSCLLTLVTVFFSQCIWIWYHPICLSSVLFSWPIGLPDFQPSPQIHDYTNSLSLFLIPQLNLSSQHREILNSIIHHRVNNNRVIGNRINIIILQYLFVLLLSQKNKIKVKESIYQTPLQLKS